MCLVYLIPKNSSLAELHVLLFSLPTTFKFSTFKQIFENTQIEHDMKPLKITQAVVTEWSVNDESCA